MSSHSAWIITRVYDTDPEIRKEIGMSGPSDASYDDRQRLLNTTSAPYIIAFRMRDDNGDLIYGGRQILRPGVTSDEDWSAPLDDFGAPNYGCTIIEHFIDGRWQRVVG